MGVSPTTGSERDPVVGGDRAPGSPCPGTGPGRSLPGPRTLGVEFPAPDERVC